MDDTNTMSGPAVIIVAEERIHSLLSTWTLPGKFRSDNKGRPCGRASALGPWITIHAS